MTYEGRKAYHFRQLELGKESPYAKEFAEPPKKTIAAAKEIKPQVKK